MPRVLHSSGLPSELSDFGEHEQPGDLDLKIANFSPVLGKPMLMAMQLFKPQRGM